MESRDNDLKSIKTLTALNLAATVTAALAQQEKLSSLEALAKQEATAQAKARKEDQRSREFSADIEWLKNSDDAGKLDFLLSKRAQDIETTLKGIYFGVREGIPDNQASFRQYNAARIEAEAESKKLAKLDKEFQIANQPLRFMGSSYPAILTAEILTSLFLLLVFSASSSPAVIISLMVIFASGIFWTVRRFKIQKALKQGNVNEINARRGIVQAQKTKSDMNQDLLLITHFKLVRQSVKDDIANTTGRLSGLLSASINLIQRDYPSGVRCNLSQIDQTFLHLTAGKMLSEYESAILEGEDAPPVLG